MWSLIIVATGERYQRAAAMAAVTYRLQNPGGRLRVSVALPEQELTGPALRCLASRFRFECVHFPFRRISTRQITTQVKTQAFVHFTDTAAAGELLIFADADTFCLRPILIPSCVRSELELGKIGVAPDVKDWHENNPNAPWYLPPHERRTYVNSGVILAMKSGAAFFRDLAALGREECNLRGGFNDQKLVNFLFGRVHRDLLVLVDRALNGLRKVRDQNTMIGHSAGGAGGLAKDRAREMLHLNDCRKIIRRCFGYER